MLVSTAHAQNQSLDQRQEGTPRFSQYYDLIYQIKVIATKAGSKSSIGSGFQISADGTIVTNFHVISSYVADPKTHRIEYLTQSNESGELELLDFDVINDIALLKRRGDPSEQHLQISATPANKGDTIFALGNPQDFGITLVTGAYNGTVEHSYNQQILFSGSLNPGMSGGPALNTNGRVIGINVAAAGSQLSFLVPAHKLTALQAKKRILSTATYNEDIAQQLKDWQRPRFTSLLNADWPVTTLGDAQVFGEIRKDFQCWGNSNEQNQEATVEILRKSCNAGNSIYLNRRFSTGQIHFAFEHKTSRSLGTYRFHQFLSNQNIGADNRGNKTDVTGFECKNALLENSKPGIVRKTVFCVRGYKKLSGLFDVLFLAEHNGDQQAFSAHFTLAGVEQDLAQSFVQKFQEQLGWK